jgi:curved DNA-binding protein CbpA
MEHSTPGRSHDDPYRVLGVDTGASRQDIARAYRRAVHGAHPDARPHDPQATARFQSLTDAYQLLSDPGRRADYDRAHRPAAQAPRQPSQPGYLGTAARWPGFPRQPLWAGPVQIEPDGNGICQQHRDSPPPTDFEDPPVILGTRPRQRGSWLW